MSHPAPFLRRVLAIDAIGCALSGVALLSSAELVSSMTALPVALIQGAGAALLPFAGLAGWLASRETPPVAGVWTVIALNAVWVIDSLLVASGVGAQPNMIGVAVVAGQALAVATLAELEFVGLRRLQPQSA